MPFAAGEAVTREGDHDDGLYMLVEGEASVRIGKGRDEREVARLTAGQFFGEMSLMTGEARTASVVAATDLVTYRIDKPAFEEILRATPAIAEQIADILVARRTRADRRPRRARRRSAQSRCETARQDLRRQDPRVLRARAPRLTTVVLPCHCNDWSDPVRRRVRTR